MWFFTHVWIIPALMALSFLLILLFGKKLPKKGAEIGIAVRRRGVRAVAADRRQLDDLARRHAQGHRRGRSAVRGRSQLLRGRRGSRLAGDEAAEEGEEKGAKEAEGEIEGGPGHPATRKAPAPRWRRPPASPPHRRRNCRRRRRGRARKRSRPARSSRVRPGSRTAANVDLDRHAGRRPVGADARRRHAHLAAGAHLLDRLRQGRPPLHPLLRLPVAVHRLDAVLRPVARTRCR